MRECPRSKEPRAMPRAEGQRIPGLGNLAESEEAAMGIPVVSAVVDVQAALAVTAIETREEQAAVAAPGLAQSHDGVIPLFLGALGSVGEELSRRGGDDPQLFDLVESFVGRGSTEVDEYGLVLDHAGGLVREVLGRDIHIATVVVAGRDHRLEGEVIVDFENGVLEPPFDDGLEGEAELRRAERVAAPLPELALDLSELAVQIVILFAGDDGRHDESPFVVAYARQRRMRRQTFAVVDQLLSRSSFKFP